VGVNKHLKFSRILCVSDVVCYLIDWSQPWKGLSQLRFTFFYIVNRLIWDIRLLSEFKYRGHKVPMRINGP
jgi:hypothetical protein